MSNPPALCSIKSLKRKNEQGHYPHLPPVSLFAGILVQSTTPGKSIMNFKFQSIVRVCMLIAVLTAVATLATSPTEPVQARGKTSTPTTKKKDKTKQWIDG